MRPIRVKRIITCNNDDNKKEPVNESQGITCTSSNDKIVHNCIPVISTNNEHHRNESEKQQQKT